MGPKKMSTIEGCPLKREVITLVHYVTDLKIVRNKEVSADEGCPFREVSLYSKAKVFQLISLQLLKFSHINNKHTCVFMFAI
jgi:hypothetical protein